MRWAVKRFLFVKVITRITLYFITTFVSFYGLASNNQSAIIETSVSNMTQGVISYSYDITDGTESSAPRLQATLQFNESADIDEVIFILRSNAGTSRLHRIANFSATNSGSNTWTLDEPLSANANGSYEYYLNFAYKSGESGSDFNGMSSMPGDGTKWANLIPAFAAEDNGYLSLPDPRITFSNPVADTEDPSFSHYISSVEGSDPSETFNSAQDAALITGNDGDPNTPIVVKLKAVFSEPVAYATDLTYLYPEEGGSYSTYNDASIQIDGSTVTYTWTFDPKTPIYRLRPYLFAYDSGLNRSYVRANIDFSTNTLADTSQPELQSISIAGRVGENQEKYIDYDLQFDATDVGTANMKEVRVSFRGPNCNSLYTAFHDYNPDSTLLPGQYKGSWRMLDNNPYGIYRISTSLYVHDQQLNRVFYSPDELINDFSIRNFSFQETVNGQEMAVPTIFCPTFTSGNQFSRIYFASNSENVVASYENAIQDGEGNVVTPRFGLTGDDADLFNISSSGVITFISPPDYENPLDADADNDYELVTHIYAYDSSDPDYVSDDNHKIDDSFTVRVDTDSDSDGVADTIDRFPSDANESIDTDGDGIGNNADPDDDNDGTFDDFDAFPLDSTEFLDTDSDGIGDNADTDDDNDGTPDTQDIFPIDDYQTALLDSDLATSPFGIVGFSASAVEDPSIILGFTSRNFSLSALGYYLESGQATDVGIWSGVGQGYELSETINTNKSYLAFNDQNDLTSTFKAPGYTNINFSALSSSEPSSIQYEIIYKFTFRLAVIEKGSEVWTLAFQAVYDEYATNATYPIAIDTSKPIRSSVGSVGTYTILSPDREIPAFTSSELIGTWMIGGINEDDMTLAPRCKEENNNGLVCADLVTLNADGTGSTQMSNRSLNWSVTSDGSLRLTFSDNNTVFSVRQVEKNAETISALVSGVANNKYFARTQLMVKQQDAVPQLDDLLLGEALASGFYVTYPGYLRSSVDNRLIEFFGFMLNADGTGTRIYEASSSTVMVDGVSVVTGVTNYSREITWSYDPDGPRKLVSKVCFSYNPLPDNFNWDDCVNLQTRTWNIVRTTSTRLYVLETIQYDSDSTGDGVLDDNRYFITRPNFYEVRTYDANDVDGDGYANDIDVFPIDATDWLDFDGDGIGDNADTDDDNDGVADGSDAFPLDATETIDTDSDGIGNNADTDDDNDGVLDNEDTFPLDASESVDTDSDGIGNNADTDDDNDGVPDESDAFPLDSAETLDTDSDGIGNNADPDDDNDGTFDDFDAFPLDSTEFLDTDSDGIGDNADTDDDNDGTPDTQDIFPIDDYQTALLDSDLATSPFGIVGFSASAVEDPSIILGFTSRNFSLSALGYYLESGQATDVGIWSGVGQGYELSETINTNKSYLAFNDQNDLTSTFKAPGYTNINFSALSSSEPSSIQYEIIYKFTFRLAVIEKGSEVWTLAFQAVYDEYATNATYPIAIDTSKPIRSSVGSVGTYTILSPDREIPAFTSSELIGTWMIGGINEDDMTLAPRCKEENNNGLVCADLVTLNADGTGSTQMSNRSLNWSVTSDGSLRLTFSDNNTVFSVRQVEKNAETISALVSGVANNKYFARTQLMVKQQDAVPQLDDLLLGEALASGFYVTYPGYLRSSVDNRLIEFFGFMLNADGTGTRIYEASSSTVMVDGVSVVTGVTNYSREITWSYDPDGPRKLVSKVCFSYNPLPDNFNWDDCVNLQTRTWNIVRTTSTRLYVLETIQYDSDSTGDGVLDDNRYFITRPNFYEVRTYDANDVDGDGYANDIDVFPIDATDWLDFDGDGIGDNADTDDDNDGVADGSDAFPLDATETIDTDSDGIGNNADTDDDNDGVLDNEDTFPLDASESVDTDSDGIGNNADTDDDNDGVPDESDAFPLISLNGLTDTDADGRPNDCDADCLATGMTADADDDNDGVLDNEDAFPLDTNESVDTDSDGIGNNADTDDDNDGVLDNEDTFPLDANESVDTDSDGTGNNADPDDDNDGTADAFDVFPLDGLEVADNDSDGIGDNADSDDDNDGIPDSQDLYPFVDYETVLLESDLSSSPFGIINYRKSAIEDPSVGMGYVSMSFSLSPLGFYFESGKSTTLGNWSTLAEGYLLSETINSPVYYLTSGSGDYQNFNWSELGLSPGDTIGASDQFEVVYRNTYRLAVIEKGSDTWKIAYQRIISTYATNTDFNIAINKNLPIKIERGEIAEFDILAPDRATIPFDNSEIVGTWAIGGILEDDVNLASDCLSDGYSCGDLVTFNADGSAETLRSERNLTWVLQQDGSIRLSFIDNGSVFFVRRLARDYETSSVLLSGAVNEKYLSQIQLMIKRQDAVPSVSDLLLNKYLVNGFTVTSMDSVRSPVDNKVVDFFGFNLYDVGNGKRIVVTTPSYGDSEGYLSYDEISWTYYSGILDIELCYYTSANSEGTQVCAQRQHRTWKLVSVTESRMYVLEILKFELDADLDGVYETLLYSLSRPNFYEWHSTFSLEDYDRDGVLNDNDLFPYDGSDWADLDGDGVGNNADSDADGDGVDNVSDAFPRDPSETLDTDNDGIGNSADTDDDNDGVLDIWTLSQLGADIYGDAEYELASRVALSGDGTTLAVGSWGANSFMGFVRIFKWDTSIASWIQHGSAIYGENQYDYTGYSISLSYDGSVVAIDASGGVIPPNEAGYVRIFAWDGQDWSQRGDKIEGEFAGDACCYLSLSADGAIIALAAQRSKGSANLTDIGQTRVFYWDGTNWYQRGLGIDGESENDRSGRWATSLSADGLTLAIGARNNEADGPDFSGHARVYKWINNAWVQRGQDIDGEAGEDYSGNSVSINHDGTLLAIGAPGNDGAGPNAGHVRLYGWSDLTSSWIKRGQDIDGDPSACDDSREYTDTDGDGITDSCGEESGWASDLSSDGTTLAVGAWKNDDSGENAGTTRIYGWDEPSQLWVQRAHDIDGEAAGDHSGYQTAISADGSVIATSAWGNTGAGGHIQAGHVRVFKLHGPADAFPLDATENLDTDSDGIGNNTDTDDDGDNVPDDADAYPLISLEGRLDTDGDGRPDECDTDCLATGMEADTDDDNDGVSDDEDAFPLDASESVDTDLDGIGNNADTDDDNDGVSDDEDAFPLDASESVDTDLDGIGNNADTDDDNDGVSDDEDAFPLDASESVDTDLDGIGNNADTDDDNDGVSDDEDAFPLDASESLDTDLDGIGNNADTDDDNDGVSDDEDAFPLDASESVDTDLDGIGNNADTDDDNDGVSDDEDAFPLDASESLDTDLDGIGNNADTDDDNDGVSDDEDAFPLDASESVDTDLDGIGNNADTDDDNDGVSDDEDAFPLDASESVDTDLDGIGNNADTDDDNDGVSDDEDAFPLDASESLDTDLDGIGNNADTDDDNDGVSDDEDAFPLDASESLDTDLDGIGNNADTDDDNDGVEDANDDLPLDPSNDSDGDGVANIDDAFPENNLYSKDSDGDGMPDSWEVIYGLDPSDPSDAASDRDNDGVSALDEFLAGTIPSGSIDLDGNERYDALTDGLLLLRGMFGLDGAALIVGTVAPDAVYTDSVDIEYRIELLGELADIDGNGQIDALTDGLLTLRYLFGLEGDSLINGVVAANATRTTAEEIEAYLETLMPVQ